MHTHADGTTHEHGTHEHGPDEPPHEHGTRPEELMKLMEFLTCAEVVRTTDPEWRKNPLQVQRVVRSFLKVLREIPCVVDLYTHNQDFKKAMVETCQMELVYGRWASHEYIHAYVYRLSDFPNDFCTIWTDYDFEACDGVFPWVNYDLFKDAGRITRIAKPCVGDPRLRLWFKE